ncbi:hypothetical protein Taro_004647 [Colocasia esculenta]|uniref:F-box domain-containing protein n=1 Tax=Colocasia esculenta TaxID=4460 RepID=A0A843TKN0_COLES|nr:hypothetical protein [Colocasia esculenta]
MPASDAEQDMPGPQWPWLRVPKKKARSPRPLTSTHLITLEESNLWTVNEWNRPTSNQRPPFVPALSQASGCPSSLCSSRQTNPAEARGHALLVFLRLSSASVSEDQLRPSVDQLGQDSTGVDQDHYEEHSAGCDDQDSTSQCYRDWSRLADHDALGLIARHLPVVDRIAVSKVCTSWRRVMISVRGRHDQKRRYGLPCLVYMHAKESAAAPSCRLLDPIHRDNKHTFEGVMARGATSRILFSRDGWLLLMSSPLTPPINDQDDRRTQCCDVFFLNLSSKSKMELPTLMTSNVHGQFSFSDRPTSPSCVVVAFLENS